MLNSLPTELSTPLSHQVNIYFPEEEVSVGTQYFSVKLHGFMFLKLLPMSPGPLLRSIREF